MRRLTNAAPPCQKALPAHYFDRAEPKLRRREAGKVGSRPGSLLNPLDHSSLGGQIVLL
jgi:hypothetical protein